MIWFRALGSLFVVGLRLRWIGRLDRVKTPLRVRRLRGKASRRSRQESLRRGMRLRIRNKENGSSSMNELDDAHAVGSRSRGLG